MASVLGGTALAFHGPAIAAKVGFVITPEVYCAVYPPFRFCPTDLRSLLSSSLPGRAAAATAQLRRGGIIAAAPALRLSGGTAITSVLDGIKAVDIDGNNVDLTMYSNIPAVLVVNLASK